MFILKGQTKQMIFRLADEATSQTYDVLFELEHIMTGKKTTFTGVDISDFRDRYSEFVWVEPTLNLEEGHYVYSVFQMPVLSPPSTNKELSVKTIDSGKLEVRGTNNKIVYDENDSKNNITFEDE